MLKIRVVDMDMVLEMRISDGDDPSSVGRGIPDAIKHHITSKTLHSVTAHAQDITSARQIHIPIQTNPHQGVGAVELRIFA